MAGLSDDQSTELKIELLEGNLLDATRARVEGRACPVFILGSPRTGSTLFYQLVAAGFELPYIANLTNDHFHAHPIVGLAVQAAFPVHEHITPLSRYGKTAGFLLPSEGSSVLRHWFGGGHPSELVSASIIPGREEHFIATMEAAQGLFEKPLVIKNAWNCFRIRYLARALPGACFIWIRRDLAAAAKSDLAARYAIHGTAECWNSATPRNVDDLRSRPYWEQVVENQAEFARAIWEAAAEVGSGRFSEVWYEELCMDPGEVLRGLTKSCKALSSLPVRRCLEVYGERDRRPVLSRHDESRIDDYIARSSTRFASLCWPTKGGSAIRT